MNANSGKGQGPQDGKQDQQGQQQGQQAQQGRQQPQQGQGEYGEGNYKAARQYNEGLKEHVENHDIEREARDAAPRSAQEEKDMQEAERIGRSKSRGEGASPDGEDETPRDPR